MPINQTSEYHSRVVDNPSHSSRFNGGPGAWALVPVSFNDYSVRRGYVKLYRQPNLEAPNEATNELILSRLGCKTDVLNVPYTNSSTLTEAEAEKITERLIETYSSNKALKDLLEGARFFAGAGTLGGAGKLRRARTAIRKFGT